MGVGVGLFEGNGDGGGVGATMGWFGGNGGGGGVVGWFGGNGGGEGASVAVDLFSIIATTIGTMMLVRSATISRSLTHIG